MVTRWTLYDPMLNVTFTFPRNPKPGDNAAVVGVDKNVSQDPPSASDGKPIVFEGAQPQPTPQFKGVCLTLAERDDLKTWARKRYQVRLTTDLGDQLWIYITKVAFTRKNTSNHEVHLDYTIDAIVLDVP